MNSRGWVERQIARRAIAALQAAGYPTFGVENGEDPYEASSSIDRIMHLLFQCDEAYLFPIKENKLGPWIRFIYGNDDGFTVISDYTTSLDEALKPVLAIDNMEAFMAPVLKAITDSREVIEDLVTGERCDHSVNVCWCREYALLERLRELS